MRWTKDSVLARLNAYRGPFVVDPFVTVSSRRWLRDRDAVITDILGVNLGDLVIVRSSSSLEGGDPDRHAGVFRSELNVCARTPNAIMAAIDAVFESYKLAGRVSREIVIVQRQLIDVAMSAVVQYPRALAYARVDYDDESGTTVEITLGRAGRAAYVWKRARRMPTPWRHLARAVDACARALRAAPVRVELAVDSRGTVHIFQAQRIPRSPLDLVAARAQQRGREEAIVACRGTVLSDMADWNPAEMLGDRAAPLDRSLYEVLITDAAWADARASLGYRRPRDTKLLRTISGKAYVDVRKSLNSLIPRGITSSLASRIVRIGLEQLAEHPHWHDKLEFRIALSCVDLLQLRTGHLQEKGIAPADVAAVRRTLASHTDMLLSTYRDHVQRDLAATSAMLARHEARSRAFRSVPLRDRLAFIHETLADCRDVGVVAFARHARVAFVVRDVFEQCVTAGAIERTELDEWVGGQDTIPRRLARAIRSVQRGAESRGAFNEVFGHLRTRTYDITATRYDSVQDLDLLGGTEGEQRSAVMPRNVLRQMNRLFKAAEMQVDSRTFVEVASAAVCMREEFKFRFSRLLSDALEWTATTVDSAFSIDREALRMLLLPDLFSVIGVGKASARAALRKTIQRRQQEQAEQALMPLPPVIYSAQDLDLMMQPRPSPNFVTQGRVRAPIVRIAAGAVPSREMVQGRIVLMEAAEPGADWLFSCDIGGLATKYGGMGSHVAVRCAAFNVPAAIGCGADLYAALERVPAALIDCPARRVLPLPENAA